MLSVLDLAHRIWVFNGEIGENGFVWQALFRHRESLVLASRDARWRTEIGDKPATIRAKWDGSSLVTWGDDVNVMSRRRSVTQIAE